MRGCSELRIIKQNGPMYTALPLLALWCVLYLFLEKRSDTAMEGKRRDTLSLRKLNTWRLVLNVS